MGAWAGPGLSHPRVSNEHWSVDLDQASVRDGGQSCHGTVFLLRRQREPLGFSQSLEVPLWQPEGLQMAQGQTCSDTKRFGLRKESTPNSPSSLEGVAHSSSHLWSYLQIQTRYHCLCGLWGFHSPLALRPPQTPLSMQKGNKGGGGGSP